MENRKLTLAILAMVVATVVSVAIVSCKKENESKMPENKACEMPASDMNMNEYLTSFKKRLLSAQKGEETLSLEQAQRDLGNLLNFDFGDAYHVTNTFHRDTLHVELATIQGQVDLSQLAHTYTLAYEQVEKAFDLVSLPNKTVYTVYCVFNPTTRNDESVDVELILTTRGYDEALALRTEPSLYDCWTVGHGYGNCDGLFVGYDHASVLQRVYNSSIPLIGCQNGVLYYTDLAQITIFAYNYPETDTSIMYNTGKRLWDGNASQYNYGHVEADEMVYYYNNLCDIIDDEMAALNDDSNDLLTISCGVHQSSSNHYYFACKIEYAKHHCITINPD